MALKNSFFYLDYYKYEEHFEEHFWGVSEIPTQISEKYHFLDYIKLGPSESQLHKSILSFLKLFNLNLDCIKLNPPDPFSKDPGLISSQLESYLKKFDLLIGITFDAIHFGHITYTLPLSHYQLLIHLLLPFGRIGLVPLKPGIYSTNELVIISAPYSHIFEYADFSPEKLVISGESVLKLISYRETNMIYQDFNVLDGYWSQSNPNTFVEYFINNYSKDNQYINE